ncbi:hypothetical protein KCU66_g28, partial [Aureobasidium melanogenum]
MSNDSDYSPDPKLQPLELNVSHRQIASGSDRPFEKAFPTTSFALDLVRYCFSPQRSGTRKHRITSIVAHDGCKSRRNALHGSAFPGQYPNDTET